MPSHLLTNLEIQKYYQKESKLNGVYSKNTFPKIKYVAYVINLDDYKSIGTHLIVLHVNDNNVPYFDSFGVEHISKEIKSITGNKNIITNISRIQACNLIMSQYFCIGSIDIMLKGKSLLDYTNLFSPNDYDENDKIILKHF